MVDNGKHLSEEHRKKLKENAKINPNYGMKGKHHSEKSLKKMSKTFFKRGQTSWNKGKHYSVKHDKQFKKGQVAWNKGIPMKEELRKKMSEFQKNRMSNPIVRKRMSELHMGKPSGNKGKIASEETRRKLSEAHKGKSTWIKGKYHSEETRKKISEATKKAMNNPEIRRRISETSKGRISGNKGKIASEETRRKLSEAHKGQIGWMKGKHHSEKSKKKMSEFRKGLHYSPKTEFKKGIVPWIKGKKLSEVMTPEKYKISIEKNRKQILERYASGKFPLQTNTKPERQIKEELLKRGYKEGIDFIHQYKFMNKFMCDFCFPQQKVIVEVYGDFWHANPKKYLDSSKLHANQIKDIGRDKSKEAYITKVDNHTWTYLVFWESDINKNVVDCVNKIEEVLNNKKI